VKGWEWGNIHGGYRPSASRVQGRAQRAGLRGGGLRRSIEREAISLRAVREAGLDSLLLITGVGWGKGGRTSPKTWLISGLVVKSPRVPKTGLAGLV
jgi:hypothetical protein